MGLLDDAIREHLELKRRRGGDPADIERAEREALGPVRRMPEPAGATASDGPFDAEHAPSLDVEYELEYDDGEFAEHRVEPMPQSHRVAGPEEPADFFDAPPRRSADRMGLEATEYALERGDRDREPPTRLPGGHAEPSDPDVLEETPEFLQDTPDHDRLWFEQRPPRDFRFDR